MRLRTRTMALVGCLLLGGCGLVKVVGADDMALTACNRWAESSDTPTSREQGITLLLSASSSASQAAELDEQYKPLADALISMRISVENQDLDDLMDAVTATYDECNKVPAIRKQMDEQINEILKGFES